MRRPLMNTRLSIKIIFYICEAPPFKTSLSFYSLLYDSVSKNIFFFPDPPTFLDLTFLIKTLLLYYIDHPVTVLIFPSLPL